MWSYDPNLLDDPERGPVMRVRFAIGDVQENRQLVQDEEIEHQLALHDNSETAAAIAAVEHISMRFHQEASFSSGEYRVELTRRAEVYEKLKDKLRRQKGGSFPKPLGTGNYAFKDRRFDQRNSLYPPGFANDRLYRS